MLRPTNETAIRSISSPQIGQRRPTGFSRRILVPSPSCSFCVLLMLIVRSFTHSSTRTLCSILCSMPLLLTPVSTSLRRYKLVSQQCPDRTMPPMPYPQQTIFTTAIGRLKLSSLAPASHRSLTRQTFIVRHIHAHLSAEVCLLSPLPLPSPGHPVPSSLNLRTLGKWTPVAGVNSPACGESGVFHTYLLDILTSF